MANLVYDMLAKTPDGRPSSMRVVADRAEMLRDALAMGAALPVGMTRADLLTAPTSTLGRDAGRTRGGPVVPPGPRGRPGVRGRRRLAAAVGGTLALCGLAIGGGLYISGHFDTRNTGDTGNNTTAQHLSPSPRVVPYCRPEHHAVPAAL